jgi:hypothetical protein
MSYLQAGGLVTDQQDVLARRVIELTEAQRASQAEVIPIPAKLS